MEAALYQWVTAWVSENTGDHSPQDLAASRAAWDVCVAQAAQELLRTVARRPTVRVSGERGRGLSRGGRVRAPRAPGGASEHTAATQGTHIHADNEHRPHTSGPHTHSKKRNSKRYQNSERGDLRSAMCSRFSFRESDRGESPEPQPAGIFSIIKRAPYGIIHTS